MSAGPNGPCPYLGEPSVTRTRTRVLPFISRLPEPLGWVCVYYFRGCQCLWARPLHSCHILLRGYRLLVPSRPGLITYHIQVQYHFIPFTPVQQPPSHGWCTILCPPYIFPSIFHHFPATRCCHTCSESGHIATFGHSHPPCHPQPGVTPLQHWPQRPFFWEAGTLIGGPPPLSSYPWQHFTHAHAPTSISSQIAPHLDPPVHPCHSSTQGSLAHHWPQRPSFWLVGAPIKSPPPPPIPLQHSMHACCRWDNNPPHDSSVEPSSRARMHSHNHLKSCLYFTMQNLEIILRGPNTDFQKYPKRRRNYFIKYC